MGGMYNAVLPTFIINTWTNSCTGTNLECRTITMVGHRSTDFEEIASEAFKGLKPVFGSKTKYLFLHLVALAY